MPADTWNTTVLEFGENVTVDGTEAMLELSELKLTVTPLGVGFDKTSVTSLVDPGLILMGFGTTFKLA
jgi:hypothetical protein